MITSPDDMAIHHPPVAKNSYSTRLLVAVIQILI